jgi:hypothetical protein
LSFISSTQMNAADSHHSTPPWVTPTTMHCYAPDSGSIMLHVCMCQETIFVFHQVTRRQPRIATRPTQVQRFFFFLVQLCCMFACAKRLFFFCGVNRLQ